jgi:TolB protein
MHARLVWALLLAVLLCANPADATFRGHNGLIAFTRWQGEDAVSIGAVSSGGGPEFTLATDAENPGWSPDGKRLAFDNPRSRDVYVADADGGNVHELSRPNTSEYAPSWSPDGKRLAFVLDPGNDSVYPGIFIATADGTALKLVRRWDANLDAPVWSPDGKWIAFLGEAGYRRHAEWDLYVIHPNGKGLRRLTHTGTDEDRPSWSPDGTRLVFARNDKVSRSLDIFVLTLRTGRTRLLIGDAATYDNEPVWSPDGTTIAFVREDLESGNGIVYLARANGRNVEQLATLSTPATDLNWQPLP